MPSFPLLQHIPKIASVAGGVSLAIGSPSIGFALFIGSAVLNLVSAICHKKRSDIGFFSVWATLNSWFATHTAEH